MTRDSTRRRFLAGLGAAGAATLAGCSNVPQGFPLADSPTPGSNGTDEQTPTETSTPDDAGPFDRGEVLADFETMDQWGTVGRGGWTADSSETYAGSQSIRLEAPQGQAAGVFRSFDGLDLSSHDLSIALKMEQPDAGRFSAGLLAPGRGNMVACNRYVVEEYDGWQRIDLGYTSQTGDPQIDNVQELRLYIRGGDQPVRAWIDDLRTIPKADTGRVIFTFDDSRASQYDVAFQRFQELDWPGGVGLIPNTVNSPDNLSIGQLREMRDAGWDIMSHPQESQGLPAYSRRRQRQIIGDAKEYLELKGFQDGARHFIAPYNGISTTTAEILDEVGHETGFTFGACANNADMPTGRYTISRVMAEDVPATRALIDLAAAYDQLLVVTVHDIAPDGTITEEAFERVVSHVRQRDVEVVAPSTLLDG